MNAYALAQTERLLANLIRVGTVAALDAAAARVTVDVGGRPLTGCRGSLGARVRRAPGRHRVPASR